VRLVFVPAGRMRGKLEGFPNEKVWCARFLSAPILKIGKFTNFSQPNWRSQQQITV
jgi:hypothetical protein